MKEIKSAVKHIRNLLCLVGIEREEWTSQEIKDVADARLFVQNYTEEITDDCCEEITTGGEPTA